MPACSTALAPDVPSTKSHLSMIVSPLCKAFETLQAGRLDGKHAHARPWEVEEVSSQTAQLIKHLMTWALVRGCFISLTNTHKAGKIACGPSLDFFERFSLLCSWLAIGLRPGYRKWPAGRLQPRQAWQMALYCVPTSTNNASSAI